MNYFFTGIAGNAMNALALYLKAKGHSVSGSDRNFDNGKSKSLASRLEKEGIKIFPQDGSGITKNIDFLIYTRVVEPDTDDRATAQKLQIPQILHRKLLGQLLQKTENICIAGTSGKTTTVSLTGYVLEKLKKDPTIFCGSKMRNFNSHLKIGKSNLVVIETDESGKDNDVISLVPPSIALVHNIARDHYPIEEIVPYFQTFLNKGEISLINLDCPVVSKLDRKKCKKIITYSIENQADIMAENIKYFFDHVEFSVQNVPFNIPLPGKHNVSNALAMITICFALGFKLSEISKAVERYKNPEMRFDIIGQKNGIWVVNDYAHNGEKLTALLKAVQPFAKQVILLFQPHGVAPTLIMKNEYIKTFSENIRPEDKIFMAEIYRRHTVENPKISSKNITEACKKENVKFMKNPEDAIKLFPTISKKGTVILVCGARNHALPYIAKRILNNL